MQVSTLSFAESFLDLAVQASKNAFVPYSGQPEAAVLLLENGEWIPGVRVESASFPLVIPSLLNAFSTAYALGRLDIAGIVSSVPVRPEEDVYLNGLSLGPWDRYSDRIYLRQTVPSPAPPTSRVQLMPASVDSDDLWDETRSLVSRAYTPCSSFPVTCILQTADGVLIPGVNVEHTDWTRILCAERNALGTAISFGLGRNLQTLALYCPKDTECTPCGACRQLLAELAPSCRIIMFRSDRPAETLTPDVLLPFSFTGKSLGHLP